MSYDKQEWLEFVGTKIRERTADALPALKMMQAQAAPMHQVLTQFDYWNRYLSFLQELINRTTARKELAQARMQDPAIWDAQQLAKLKSDILTADAMIQAWDVAMKLPKALIEDAEKAKELIEQFEKKDESAVKPDA